MRKILILEDTEQLGSIYKKHLERTGYSVLWVKTCNDAENALDMFNPDIIYSDCNIKGDTRSGFDMLPIFRNKYPNAYIFMISNNNDWQMKEKAIKLGANNYFIKIDMMPRQFTEMLSGLRIGIAFDLWKVEFNKLPGLKAIQKKVAQKSKEYFDCLHMKIEMKKFLNFSINEMY